MKNLIIFVAMIILFSGCVTAQASEGDLGLTTSKPHWPFRGIGRALPPLPAGHFHPVPFHPPPEVTKCLSDCRDVHTCLAEIARAFFTRKVAIGSDCCASINKMNEDCEKTVFGSFHNPFFNCYVKLHCSNNVGSSPAPSPA